MIIATGDSVHPFALADNRHYVFYIYRKWLLRAAWRRLALVPLCAWGAVSPVLELEWRRRQERTRGATADARAGMSAFYIAEYVSDALLVLSAAATLLPTPLLEPRYFVVPSTLLIVRRMERREMEFVTFEVICVAAALTLVNVALVYVFAEMPFDRPVDLHMPNDLSPGRFMF